MTAFVIGSDEWAGLSKLIEEAGEVILAAGKLMQGRALRMELHWDGSDCKQRLCEEMADLRAAIMFVQEVNNLPWFNDRVEEKMKLYRQWHAEQKEPQP